jgi:tetratricopeptide (TPR) repeat protein
MALFGWCAWFGVCAGASRLLSDYAVRSGNPEAAELAARLAPEDPEAHYALAGLLATAGNNEAAILGYQRALSLRPGDYVIWLELGKVYDSAGKVEAALGAFREAVKLAPHYAQPRWQLGQALLRAGRREEAFTELRRAAESNKTLYPNLIEAAWHAAAGDMAFFLAAVEPRGNTLTESLILANFLIRQGEVRAATDIYRKLGGGVTDAERRSLVAALITSGNYPEAYAIWADAAEDGRDGLTGGGFEGALRTDGEGFDWQFAPDQTYAKFSLDEESPREGKRSLRLDLSGNSAPSARLISRLVPVTPGARYRVEFSARTREVVTGGPLIVRIVEAEGARGGEALGNTQPLPTGTTEGWRDFSVEFSTRGNTKAVRLVLERQNCTSSPCPAFGHVWFDRFALKEL